ncbi:hypothetical protein U0070_004002 [Myodes glareolus]|uniref:Uncharacterized protein n=1 Tax=Myodes glareolus TaxID=447135 RepID=A0AAW0KDM2_MYOGA
MHTPQLFLKSGSQNSRLHLSRCKDSSQAPLHSVHCRLLRSAPSTLQDSADSSALYCRMLTCLHIANGSFAFCEGQEEDDQSDPEDSDLVTMLSRFLGPCYCESPRNWTPAAMEGPVDTMGMLGVMDWQLILVWEPDDKKQR